MSAKIDDSDWTFCENVEELINFLQKHVEDKESSVRISSVLGLLLITATHSEFYEGLIIYLKSLLILDDIYVRGSAALSIGFLGTNLKDPIPFLDMLKLLLFDEARFVKRNASIGIAFIMSTSTSKERRDLLIKDLFSSAYWYFRISGAIGLGYFCQESALDTVIKKLKPLLNDSDIDVRIGAVYGLGFLAKRFGYNEELAAFFKSCLYDYDQAVIQSARVVLNLLSFP